MMLFHRLYSRRFVISVAAVSAGVFFIKRILYCIHEASHIIAQYFKSCNFLELGGAEEKDSDLNHSKALYILYYQPHLLPKLMGSIPFKLLSSHSYPPKLRIYMCGNSSSSRGNVRLISIPCSIGRLKEYNAERCIQDLGPGAVLKRSGPRWSLCSINVVASFSCLRMIFCVV